MFSTITLYEFNADPETVERLSGLEEFCGSGHNRRVYMISRIKDVIIDNEEDDTNQSVKNTITDIVNFCEENDIDGIIIYSTIIGECDVY